VAVTHAQTTVSTTAVALGRVSSNEALTVQNNSAVTVLLGGPTVTTSVYGYALAPGGVIAVDLPPGNALYAIAASSCVVGVLSVDAHVEFDRIGSRDEYVQ